MDTIHASHCGNIQKLFERLCALTHEFEQIRSQVVLLGDLDSARALMTVLKPILDNVKMEIFAHYDSRNLPYFHIKKNYERVETLASAPDSYSFRAIGVFMDTQMVIGCTDFTLRIRSSGAQSPTAIDEQRLSLPNYVGQMEFLSPDRFAVVTGMSHDAVSLIEKVGTTYQHRELMRPIGSNGGPFPIYSMQVLPGGILMLGSSDEIEFWKPDKDGNYVLFDQHSTAYETILGTYLTWDGDDLVNRDEYIREHRIMSDGRIVSFAEHYFLIFNPDHTLIQKVDLFPQEENSIFSDREMFKEAQILPDGQIAVLTGQNFQIWAPDEHGDYARVGMYMLYSNTVKQFQLLPGGYFVTLERQSLIRIVKLQNPSDVVKLHECVLPTEVHEIRVLRNGRMIARAGDRVYLLDEQQDD